MGVTRDGGEGYLDFLAVKDVRERETRCVYLFTLAIVCTFAYLALVDLSEYVFCCFSLAL